MTHGDQTPTKVWQMGLTEKTRRPKTHKIFIVFIMDQSTYLIFIPISFKTQTRKLGPFKNSWDTIFSRLNIHLYLNVSIVNFVFDLETRVLRFTFSGFAGTRPSPEPRPSLRHPWAWRCNRKNEVLASSKTLCTAKDMKLVEELPEASRLWSPCFRSQSATEQVAIPLNPSKTVLHLVSTGKTPGLGAVWTYHHCMLYACSIL